MASALKKTPRSRLNFSEAAKAAKMVELLL